MMFIMKANPNEKSLSGIIIITIPIGLDIRIGMFIPAGGLSRFGMSGAFILAREEPW